MQMSESSPKPKRQYDENFKRQAVEHWRKSGKTRKAIAEELGINQWALRDWARQFERANKPASTVEELESENQRLKRELAQMREQRDILKKTLGILSEP
jgi:transposase